MSLEAVEHDDEMTILLTDVDEVDDVEHDDEFVINLVSSTFEFDPSVATNLAVRWANKVSIRFT